MTSTNKVSQLAGRATIVFLVLLSLLPLWRSIKASAMSPVSEDWTRMGEALSRTPINPLTILLSSVLLASLMALIWTFTKGKSQAPKISLEDHRNKAPRQKLSAFLAVGLILGAIVLANSLVFAVYKAGVPRLDRSLRISPISKGEQELVVNELKGSYSLSSLSTPGPNEKAKPPYLGKAAVSSGWALYTGGEAVTFNGKTRNTDVLIKDGDRIEYQRRLVVFQEKVPNTNAQLGSAAAAKVLEIILLLILCLALSKDSKSDSMAALGLTKSKLSTEMLRGLRVYLCFLPLLALIVIGTKFGAEALGLQQVPHPLQKSLMDSGSSTLALGALIAIIGAPISEEFIFRGLLLGVFSESSGCLAAIIASAWLFACMHVGVHSIFPIFALGLLLGYTTATAPNRSITAAITIHMLHNSLALGLFLVTRATLGT